MPPTHEKPLAVSHTLPETQAPAGKEPSVHL